MEKKNESWERLQRVIANSGLSVNGFASHIGLSRGENLYQIKRGNNAISKDVARRINEKFPQYSITWLMTGIPEAPQFIVDENKVVRLPLYYNYTAENFSQQDEPDDHLILSASVANGAEMAVAYSDTILNPYLQNSLLLIKRHDGQILYGNIYLVETRHFRLFRIVTKDEKHPDSVCLTTLQPSVFIPIIIPQKDITALWLVVGAVSGLCR